MKNQYKITKDLMQTWAKEYHLHGAANVILFIIWCVFGVIGISGLIFSIALHSEWMAIYIYALLTIIAVFKLFLARFVVWSKRYKLYSTTYGVSEWIRTTEFLDDEIILTDHTSVSKLKYSNIEKIIYISCNPQTWQSDAEILKSGGYQVTTLTPVDQFCGSTHWELFSVFEK